jgi:glycosyltransferase involved in cell wall biosynthesis
LTVVGLTRPESLPRAAGVDNIEWRLADEPARPAWKNWLSPLPQVSLRCRTPQMAEHVRACLAEGGWDAIIFDSIAVGWALDDVIRAIDPARTCVVYFSHNDETVAARHMSNAASGLRRFLRGADAWRVARLERAMVAHADLISANTPEDQATFAAAAPGKPVLFLPPGFEGERVADRVLDASLPRRAVIVGSFDWTPKRVSLEAFLAAAVPQLAAAQVELQVVGSAEASYIADLRRRYPGVDFTGPVPDVRPYMGQARLALVPDLLGGFKLKALDYVFNRLPIFAMRIAVPGMALRDGDDIRLFDTHLGLAQGVVAAIDDLPALNAQQQRAYASCNDRFDWGRIIRELFDGIADIKNRPTAGGHVAASVATAPAGRS